MSFTEQNLKEFFNERNKVHTNKIIRDEITDIIFPEFETVDDKTVNDKNVCSYVEIFQIFRKGL